MEFANFYEISKYHALGQYLNEFVHRPYYMPIRFLLELPCMYVA